MSDLAPTPRPPYFAVIFTSRRNDQDANRYLATAQRMEELASEQPGFLGMESARASDGVGITVSYWRNLESVKAWKRNADHVEAQRMGRDSWYDDYHIRICRVENDYGKPETADL